MKLLQTGKKRMDTDRVVRFKTWADLIGIGNLNMTKSVSKISC